jgi:phosphoribosylcarboxyaminoimidazole (NCAIR) mutase
MTGHVHNYQRFTRPLNGRDVPYIVAGAGGYWHLHTMAHDTTGAPCQ